jgi:hypothetical protein
MFFLIRYQTVVASTREINFARQFSRVNLVHRTETNIARQFFEVCPFIIPVQQSFRDAIGPRISFRAAGIISASPRTRASSESRLSVSRSQGSGSRSGVSRCGALMAREDGVKEGERGTFNLAILINVIHEGIDYDFI